MEHSLNRAMRTRPSHDTQGSGQPISLGTRAMSALIGFLGLNTSLATGNGLPRYNPKLQRRNHGLANPSSQVEGRWLLVCAKIGRYATKLSHMDVCATNSDKDLFTELRKAYIDLRSRWTRLFTLRGIKSIRFVQVYNPTLTRILILTINSSNSTERSWLIFARCLICLREKEPKNTSTRHASSYPLWERTT